jgi:hypothetical protein
MPPYVTAAQKLIDSLDNCSDAGGKGKGRLLEDHVHEFQQKQPIFLPPVLQCPPSHLIPTFIGTLGGTYLSAAVAWQDAKVQCGAEPALQDLIDHLLALFGSMNPARILSALVDLKLDFSSNLAKYSSQVDRLAFEVKLPVGMEYIIPTLLLRNMPPSLRQQLTVPPPAKALPGHPGVWSSWPLFREDMTAHFHALKGHQEAAMQVDGAGASGSGWQTKGKKRAHQGGQPTLPPPPARDQGYQPHQGNRGKSARPWYPQGVTQVLTCKPCLEGIRSGKIKQHVRPHGYPQASQDNLCPSFIPGFKRGQSRA